MHTERVCQSMPLLRSIETHQLIASLPNQHINKPTTLPRLTRDVDHTPSIGNTPRPSASPSEELKWLLEKKLGVSAVLRLLLLLLSSARKEACARAVTPPALNTGSPLYIEQPKLLMSGQPWHTRGATERILHSYTSLSCTTGRKPFEFKTVLILYCVTEHEAALNSIKRDLIGRVMHSLSAFPNRFQIRRFLGCRQTTRTISFPSYEPSLSCCSECRLPLSRFATPMSQ